MTWLAEDHERLVRFRAGDRALLGEVFRIHAPGLSRHLALSLRVDDAGRVRRGASPSDVDDVVQETFIRAFTDRARAGYDGLRPYSAYLVGIARHVLADWQRTGARRRRLFEETAASPTDADVEAPLAESSVLAREIEAVVRELLDSLGEADRVLALLRVFGDTSRREASERTGYSPMRVRLREIALRRQLHARLAAAGLLSPPSGAAAGTGRTVKP